jgi:hypothetical protein
MEEKRQVMRIFYSYARLFIASWLFMAGLSLQFLPSAAQMARDAHWRERQLASVPADQQAKWVEDRDTEDARAYAYLRIFGVLLGGLGLAAALRETAYLSGKYGR